MGRPIPRYCENHRNTIVMSRQFLNARDWFV
jgi:hypothetical protein